ncbi:MAG TPA: hypothetical protein VK171_13410, partial [Fimbriimonas sp.]|nr:hypothetical protein [Fimbriimonas sp.]
MRGTLIIHLLTTRSNFIENIEEPANGHPEVDTEQWWIAEDHTFMFHTYALNRDVRIWQVPTKLGMMQLAHDTTHKSYGDIIDRTLILGANDWTNPDEQAKAFEGTGLEPTVVVNEGAFVFWRLGDADYQTLSGI